MKVVMINDCAFVGETLLKYLPADIERQHIKRSRGLWSKTFGVAYSILKSKADVYHAYYLLQDCYIAARLGKKPLVGHAMGSDLRDQLESRKWGWIVKSNLRRCDKVLVSQPTILEVAKKHNSTAEYFPIPFDPRIFFPKPLNEEREEKQVLIASGHDFSTKGTDKLLKALASVEMQMKIKAIRFGKNLEEAVDLAGRLGLEIDFVERVRHEQMSELYWESDLVLGSFGIGQLDTVGIEAMACSRPLVHSVNKKFFPDCPLEQLETVEETSKLISSLLFDADLAEKRIMQQLQYVNATHAAPKLADRLMKVYSDLVSAR